MAVNDQFFNVGNNPNLDAADTGIDPATGKILTNEERKQIFARRSILGKSARQAIAKNTKMNFGGGGALVLAGKGAIEEKKVQAQGGALVAPVNNLSKRVDALEATVANIQTSLANIRKVIIKGNEVDAKIQEELAKQQTLFLENKEKQEAEAELEESDLEKEAGVQVEKQEKKTFGFFEGLKKGLMLLFGGFIVQKAFKLFNAWKDGNTELFKELGIDLNSALQQITTGVFFFQKIIGNLIKLARNFVGSIGKLVTKVITFPFRMAGKMIRTGVRKAFVGIKRAIGPGMRKFLKKFGLLSSEKVTKEVTKKVGKKVAGKVAKKGILGSIPIIGTGLDIWGAVSEGMKGNWVGAGLYTAGAITSLIPGMQGVSGVLSVSAMGQSIHSDLKRDAKKNGIDVEGNGVEISGMQNNNFNNLGPTVKPPVNVNVVQAGEQRNSNGAMIADAGNNVPDLNSSNRENLYDNFAISTYNAYSA